MEGQLAARFEAKVDRSDEHHLWTGAHQADGTGMFKVPGVANPVAARKVAWEMANGPVPVGARVLSCDVKACVRVEHLSLDDSPAAHRRSARPVHKRVQVQVNGVRVHRRVRGTRADVESTRSLLRSQLAATAPQDRDATRWSLSELIEHYLVHLEQQGRELRTRVRYAGLAKNWVDPVIGPKLARRVNAEDVDRCFALMRKSGQSAGSMNYAKALLSGAFEWARRTGNVLCDPMLGFQMPKSTYVPSERLPPEAADISVILHAALEHTPDIAPILVLAATTGARLGELVVLRRSDVDWQRRMMWVHSAADLDGTLKGPKRPQHRRQVPLDEATLEVLRRQLEELEERTAFIGVPIDPDPFIFSIEPDCSKAIARSRVTKPLQVLKGHLGVEDKRAETIALEDEALRLRRHGSADRTGRPGPPPRDGAAMSYDDIAAALGRSQMWAARACESALRRERAGGEQRASFNLSFNGFRKFSSSELLDAGFDLSVVAQRQGHGPQVLVKHYSKARMSAQRKAADHLGHVAHGLPAGGETT